MTGEWWYWKWQLVMARMPVTGMYRQALGGGRAEMRGAKAFRREELYRECRPAPPSTHRRVVPETPQSQNIYLED